jgi:hypothetical protein
MAALHVVGLQQPLRAGRDRAVCHSMGTACVKRYAAPARALLEMRPQRRRDHVPKLCRRNHRSRAVPRDGVNMANDNKRPFVQRIYDSEINAGIEWFWDGGFSISLGDPDNPDAKGAVKTWREVEAFFREQILRHYPDSAF